MTSGERYYREELDYIRRYARLLAQLLLCRTFPPQLEEQLNWLLSELVEYFAAEINAPRWIRTADGVKFIEEAMA